MSHESGSTANLQLVASCDSAASCEVILTAALAGNRISAADALALALHADEDALFATANSIRERWHPDSMVTYVVDRNINYSNVCTSVCSFCAFYRKPGDPEGYLLSLDEIHQKVDETIELGGSGTLMQGGLHPDLPLSWYTDMIRSIKKRHPDFYLHCFSPTEIHALTSITDLDCETILTKLKDAGLDSIPGGGGEILVDAIRKRRRSSCGTEDWLQVSATAHRIGLPTTATMMIGLGEETWMRAEHLDRIRQVQDQTGGFISFIPWTFQPDNTALGRKISERVPVLEYARWLAVSRIFLDNIANLQVSWLTVGLEEGRRGLQRGANDLGSVMIEENVISVAGAHHTATEKLLCDTIVEAGFEPALRNAGYRRLAPRSIPAECSEKTG
ncbi:MAG: dehypoxanthine futalosine cyclase [Planctomycetota bacterium]|nr:dehypoxanthine futalosine cyclase [Planctomycetota bacterium]